MRIRTLALALLPVLALSACDSSDSDTPEVGGTYRAAYNDGDQTFVLTLDIEDTDGGTFDFDGTLRVTTLGETETLDVEGTGEYNYPDITLTAEANGESDTLEGTVSIDGDTITAETDDLEIVLERQE